MAAPPERDLFERFPQFFNVEPLVTEELVVAVVEELAQLPEPEVLTVHFCGACGRFAFHEPTTCYWCREAEG